MTLLLIELESLVESLDKTCTKYKMEINAEKTKLMTNNASGFQREIRIKGQKLGTVTSFKYLGAIASDEGLKPEALSRIAQATAGLAMLNPIWRDINKSQGPELMLRLSYPHFRTLLSHGPLRQSYKIGCSSLR